jgi:hypothetical protein
MQMLLEPTSTYITACIINNRTSLMDPEPGRPTTNRPPRLYYPPAFPALRTHRSTRATPGLLSELLQVARSVVLRFSKAKSLP